MYGRIAAAIVFAGFFSLSAPAEARHHHHHFTHHHYRHVGRQAYAWATPVESGSRPHDCYGIPWCGCFMRHLMGVADKAYNLARNWAHWGHAAFGPAPGVVGVLPHHVFRVIEVLGPGRVLAISGNDGHAVRTRSRSTRGVIAWRSM